MGSSGTIDNLVPVLTSGKFEMAKMRELVANWVLMHEHPFTVVEEEGFNDISSFLIVKQGGIPQMLTTALKFKNVFLRYRDKDLHFDCCPDPEDWFLVKVMLDAKALDKNDFIQDMVKKMKKKFDKYWGECNLLMCVASVVDRRCKKAMLEYCFPRMYEEIEAQANMLKVKDALYEIYQEYVDESQSFNNEQSAKNRVVPRHMKVVQSVPPEKSKLNGYLEEGCYISHDRGDPTTFDALQWWKVNTLKYRLLSKMACDILAIPITTIASEATFSAGSRVIETYRASLSPETVSVLLCGGDWCRNLGGLKRKNKFRYSKNMRRFSFPSNESHS
ncbi:zinc finger BED domain-containing protein RICESLEEPER 1-like [Pistacia vera]|uniref:zinc finger BED domain-containing protein RICESLEEPER 1-like n=1 Tax=Pistacia vera TaxID=55513 RepID=UPI0012637858|nr:zinc finger BED domain-containing protein RICESLEEPER 1-like [Pistacia vera]